MYVCVHKCVNVRVMCVRASSALLIPSSVLRSTPWWCSGAKRAAWGLTRCAHLASCLLLHQRHVLLSCCPQPESLFLAALSRKRHPVGQFLCILQVRGWGGTSSHFLLRFLLPTHLLFKVCPNPSLFRFRKAKHPISYSLAPLPPPSENDPCALENVGPATIRHGMFQKASST